MKSNWMVVYYENGLCIDWKTTEEEAKKAAMAAIDREKASTVWVGKLSTTFSRSVVETKADQ